MPPAFALSQDQTLKFIRSNASVPAVPLGTARPSTSELRHHSLQKHLSQRTEVAFSPPLLSHIITRPCPVPRSTSRLSGSKPAHSSARTPATHPSPGAPSRSSPPATTASPQVPATQHNVQLHAAPVLPRSPTPHPSHPAPSARSHRQNARSLNSKTPIRISRSKPFQDD